MNSIRAMHDQVAVSANSMETAINTAQTLDTALLVDTGTIIQLEQKREDNGSELTGKEEADTIYDMGATSSTSFNFEKAQPQHFALLYGYGLGAVSTAGAGTGGYEHTITPIAGDLDGDRSLPTLTAAQRFGKTIVKRLFSSLAVDTVTSTFAKGAWVKLSAGLKGTGQVVSDVVSETLTADDDVTSLTLAALGVAGATAEERLDNVQAIKVELTTGVWTEVAYTAVSAASPAVITIVDPGGLGAPVSYKVLFRPDESGWGTFPARVAETPLRVSELTVVVGGTWGGSAFTGGRELTSEITSIEHTLSNNLQVESTPGAGGAYANRIFRDGRQQSIKLNREFRDYILQQNMTDNDTFGVRILAEGAIYDTPHKYQVEMIFPLCAVLNAPLSVDGKRLAEAGDLKVLEHATYGSVIVKVKNKVATYAA